jgi:hypothetical protein
MGGAAVKKKTRCFGALFGKTRRSPRVSQKALKTIILADEANAKFIPLKTTMNCEEKRSVANPENANMAYWLNFLAWSKDCF